MTNLFLSQDSSSRAAGGRNLEKALRASAGFGKTFELHLTGSRGAFFMEPMIEVATAAGRVAYGPVVAADVNKLLERGMLEGEAIAPYFLGLVQQIPFLRGQTRVTFARCGEIETDSLAAYRAAGGYRALRRVLLEMQRAEVIQEVERSGLRGRGGAAFPTAAKWRTAAGYAAPEKFVVANCDEGDPGTYADRMLMEGDPFAILEGMAICARAIGAQKGFIYVRAEYPRAGATMSRAMDMAREGGCLGRDILGSGFDFDVELRYGGGAYVCGEETALLESLEGRRGLVRPKPPYPATHGLFGMPTLINNITTLATVPAILDRGGAWYAAMGTERCRGTMAMQLGGALRTAGLVEVPFGTSLRKLVEEYGGGVPAGRRLMAVQVGGPLGELLGPEALDLPIDFDTFAAAGAMLGHGGVVVYDDRTDALELAQRLMDFCVHESCGKCAPCRMGSQRAGEILQSWSSGGPLPGDRETLEDIAFAMRSGSLCALGGMATKPVMSALRQWSATKSVK